MIRNITLLFLLCLSFNSFAQDRACGFSKAQQAMIATDPSYAAKIAAAKERWRTIALGNGHHAQARLYDNGIKRVFQIPIVIHVLTTGGAIGTNYNPTDAQLIGMVDYLNNVYAANGAYAPYPDSTSGGVSIPIQFVLAQRDSNCNATNGIERIDASAVTQYLTQGIVSTNPNINEIALKNLSRWPEDQYYNVYIVSMIDGDDGYTGTGVYTAGYAYTPPAPASVDGIVMLAHNAIAGDVTLPHEIGHSLSLLHPFDDSDPTNCPPNADCTVDNDGICDTEPVIQAFDCPSDPNPCTGSSYNNTQHNIMSYYSCTDRFTLGQRARVIDGLINYRSGIIGSSGGLAPDVITAATCIPTITNAGNGFDVGPREVKIADNFYSPYINTAYVFLDYSSGGYNSDGNQVYIDHSCKQRAELTAGTAYKFYVQAGSSNTGEKVRIYIDFNNNGTFEPATETVMSIDGNAANQLDSVVFAIPTPAVMPSLVLNTPLRMRVISDRATVATVDPCGALGYGQAEDYAIVLKASAATETVTISLPAGEDTSCVGSSLSFSSTQTGATNPTYQWFVNGVGTGITTPTLTTSALADGATVYLQMYFAGPDSVVSNTITVHRVNSITPGVSIAVTQGNNPGCAGYGITFTAFPSGGGTAPTYQWNINGVPVAGSDSVTFTRVFTVNDIVTCTMVSNSPCASIPTAASNSVTITNTTITAAIIITSSATMACSGHSVTFTAVTTNEGNGATYHWFVNNVMVPGATNSTYVTDTLANNDNVKCVLTAPDPCVVNHSVTSNTIVETVSQSSAVTATSVLVHGSNPGCEDSLMVFAGSDTGYAAPPQLTWLVNGVPTASGDTFSSLTLHGNDVVVLQVTPTDGACYLPDTALTTPIVLNLTPIPTQPLLSLIGDMLVVNGSDSAYIWYGPNGLITGETGSTIHPQVLGEYYVLATNNGCYSVASNILTVSLLNVGSYNLAQVRIFPNPNAGNLVLDWGNNIVNMKVDVYDILGQSLLHEDIAGQSHKELNLAALTNGNYFVVLKDEQGKTATVKITLAR